MSNAISRHAEYNIHHAGSGPSLVQQTRLSRSTNDANKPISLLCKQALIPAVPGSFLHTHLCMYIEIRTASA